MNSAQQSGPLDSSQGNFLDKLKQQKLPAWQFNFDANKVLSLYAACTFIFLIVGFTLLGQSNSVVEVTYRYSDAASKDDIGKFNVPIPSQMEPPIYIYYELENFYQNHRRYVVSRNADQLARNIHPPLLFDPEGVKECDPWAANNGAVHYPCGLVAYSVFNDTFAIVNKGKAEGRSLVELASTSPKLARTTEDRVIPVDNSAQAIAWPADLPQAGETGRFLNQDPEAKYNGNNQFQTQMDMWILQRFPPVKCVQKQFSDGMKPIDVKTKTIPGTGNAARINLTVPICTGYSPKGGNFNPKCEFEKECVPPEYEEQKVLDWGIESGHFAVWMRVAGLPTFRKLWGVINEPIEANTNLEVHFRSLFPVESFGGSKTFVLSTSSNVGGKQGSNFLAWGYIFIGFTSLLYAAIFFFKKK